MGDFRVFSSRFAATLLAASVSIGVLSCGPDLIDGLNAIEGLPRTIEQTVEEGDPSPPTRTVTATNVGAYDLDYSVQVQMVDEGLSWLSVSPDVPGTITFGNSQDFVISVDVVTDNLRPGTYTGTIVFEAVQHLTTDPALGSPYEVAVNLTVTSLTAAWSFDTNNVEWDSNEPLAWVAMSDIDAPTPRSNHTAVWTGDEMIIWGGTGEDNPHFGNGGRYEPITDTWRAVNSRHAAVPTARANHTAVWTGSEMIVWGGQDSGGVTKTGAAYDPSTDTWRTIPEPVFLEAREFHIAVWTGQRMIVWGGRSGGVALSTGGVYDPVGDTWLEMADPGASTGRLAMSAVWTGDRMIIWGGADTNTPVPNRFNTGLIYTYSPTGGSWTTTQTNGAPEARSSHTAIWTGREMIVFGGFEETFVPAGGRYDPFADRWSDLMRPSEEPEIYEHTAVWTGREMLIWGGISPTGTTARFNPHTGAWAALPTASEPDRVVNHTAVWTGESMIPWGGSLSGVYYGSLARLE